MTISDTAQTAFNPDSKAEPTRHVITSDVDGTLLIMNEQGTGKVINLPLIHFLLDAAEKGHTVYIVTGGYTDSAERILKNECAEIKRPFPDSIKVLSKYDLCDLSNTVTIAFDDFDFNYLGTRPKSLLAAVQIGIFGDPSIPFDELRRMTGTMDTSSAAAAPAPTAPQP